MKMLKTRKLVIVGDSAFAQIAREYFDCDSEYSVVAFAVESQFLAAIEIAGLPVVGFENVEKHYPPEEHDIFVAITYTQLNRLRTRLSGEALTKGFKLASYISSKAFVWRNVQVGSHCFVFENNTIQPFVSVGNNVVIWSGNHLGHHSIIRDNCFISSHVVISGFCEIGEYSFLGVNSAISNNVVIGSDNWIGPGVTVLANSCDGALFKGVGSTPSRISARKFFKV